MALALGLLVIIFKIVFIYSINQSKKKSKLFLHTNLQPQVVGLDVHGLRPQTTKPTPCSLRSLLTPPMRPPCLPGNQITHAILHNPARAKRNTYLLKQIHAAHLRGRLSAPGRGTPPVAQLRSAANCKRSGLVRATPSRGVGIGQR